MKKTLILIGGVAVVGSMSASAAVTLVAGWETFGGSNNWSTTQLAGETTAKVSATTEHNDWSNWNNNSYGASTDGTFGSLSTSIAGAAVNTSNLSLNQSNGTLTFTLTNDSGTDRTLEGFHFDAVHRFSSASAWAITYGGAISGTGTGGAISDVYGGMPAATPAVRDKAVDLSGLTDNVWEAGSDAIFTLAFTGAPNSGSGGGVEMVVDNIGITATIIPEPSTFALLGLGGLALLLRRRA